MSSRRSSDQTEPRGAPMSQGMAALPTLPYNGDGRFARRSGGASFDAPGKEVQNAFNPLDSRLALALDRRRRRCDPRRRQGAAPDAQGSHGGAAGRDLAPESDDAAPSFGERRADPLFRRTHSRPLEREGARARPAQPDRNRAPAAALRVSSARIAAARFRIPRWNHPRANRPARALA